MFAKSVFFTLILVVTATAYEEVEVVADPFEPSNVQAFVENQFQNFFTDCDAFAGGFTKTFDYNDVVRISDSKKQLRDICRETEGTVNELHTGLSIKPGTFPFPLYDYISITGMQSVCVDIDDENGLQPICFDFVITEMLKSRKRAPFGLKSKNWTGYYNILLQSCPGFDTLDCKE